MYCRRGWKIVQFREMDLCHNIHFHCLSFFKVSNIRKMITNRKNHFKLPFPFNSVKIIWKVLKWKKQIIENPAVHFNVPIKIVNLHDYLLTLDNVLCVSPTFMCNGSVCISNWNRCCLSHLYSRKKSIFVSKHKNTIHSRS